MAEQRPVLLHCFGDAIAQETDNLQLLGVLKGPELN